jgi:DNA-binding protein YbaB
MSSDNKVLAQRVVQSFKENLTPEVRDRIRHSDFDMLELMIREAIADRGAMLVEQVEELLRKLRTEMERPPIEL